MTPPDFTDNSNFKKVTQSNLLLFVLYFKKITAYQSALYTKCRLIVLKLVTDSQHCLYKSSYLVDFCDMDLKSRRFLPSPLDYDELDDYKLHRHKPSNFPSMG